VIGLDTNVLVRFLVRDDARQSNIAAAFIERSVSANEDLFICDIVVCETACVLSTSYKVPRTEIARTFSELLLARNVVFESADQLSRAIAAFGHGKGDLADCIVRERAQGAGCDAVVTFDKDLLRERLFRAP